METMRVQTTKQNQKQNKTKNLLERCEAVNGEGVGLDGAAVEQHFADVEARGSDLGCEDELRRGGDHVHVVSRSDQVPHHLQEERTEEGRGVRRRDGIARGHQGGGVGREGRRTSRARVACPKPWPVM